MPSDGARWIFVALSSSSIMSHRCLGAAVLPSVSLPPTENPGECDRTMEKDDLSFLDDFEYDRVEILLDLDACFERTISSRNVRQLVLLTGPSGCGKTRTAHKFGTHISEKSGGFFLSGKSDQIQKRAYAPFISAFTEFARLTEQRGPEFVECIKTKVRDSIALELTILTDMIPSLTEILGDEPATTTTDNDLRAITRTEVALVFSKFLLAISSKESPIVLFCDDMQWMDPESLDLLESLVASQNEELGWVMVLGACRSNEIAFDHPLAVHLRKVEDFGVSIINMSLDNLDRIAIQDVISGLYDLPEIANSRLSLLIQKETRGNLYLLVECLRSLHEEHILYCDPDSKEWKYNDLETRLAMGDILSFVKFKFEMLPEKAQEAVLILSCIGAEIEIVVAATLLSPDSYRSLSYPEENGLVHFDDKGARVAFAHAFVQSALYESMPESERISRHLSVGRILLSKLQKADLGGQILLVADQFKLGLSQTEDQEERHRLAAVFLCAGRKAASASGFTPAKNYLDTGISLLSSNHWVSAYALSLDLYNAAAEAALVNGDFDRTDFLIEEILDHVRTSEDKLQAETTKIYSLGARGEMLRATESGLAVLRVQGVKIPRKATTMKSALEIFRTRVRLANKSDEDLLSMPPLRDPEMTHILRMMNLILFYAYVSEPDYVLIIATQIIRLTLRYGLSDMCAFSFAIYGAILSGVMGRIKEGYRYGQLCLRLLEKSHNRGTWMARVFPCVYSIINVWCHHVEESLGPMKFAHSAALESGDIEIALLNGHTRILLCFSAGWPLPKLLPMMQKIRNLAISYKQDGMLPLIEAKLQEALNLSGRSDDVFVLSGEVMEQNEALEKARRGQNWLLRYAISVWQCEIACFMGDYGRAAKHAEHARLVQKKRLEDLWTYTTSFYEVISVLAIARECDSIGRRLRLHKQANRILKYMRRLGKFGSPNFSHMITLVEAEVAWLHGSHDDALRKYDKAISLARQGRFRHHHALACERKALSLRVGGDHLGWSSAIVEARSLYSEWGALVKLEQLDKAIGKKDSVD